MKRILIFGNSASGKSTLAKRLVDQHGLAHLDLDTIAWQATLDPQKPPERQSISESKRLIDAFCSGFDNWVIEGCYSDLIEMVSERANQAIFMDLSISECVENAKNRPWEQHKYASKEAQDQNLAMLLDWIKDYENRTDTFSKRAHQDCYEKFNGQKKRILSNRRSDD